MGALMLMSAIVVGKLQGTSKFVNENVFVQNHSCCCIAVGPAGP